MPEIGMGDLFLARPDDDEYIVVDGMILGLTY